ncbi:MAG TPA: hypothetical protein VI322_05485 [Candidatus Saccharimonadia bacterium]
MLILDTKAAVAEQTRKVNALPPGADWIEIFTLNHMQTFVRRHNLCPLWASGRPRKVAEALELLRSNEFAADDEGAADDQPARPATRQLVPSRAAIIKG